MAQFGASIQTAQVTTGNFQTTVDPYTATPTTGSVYAGYPQYQGNRAIPGAAYYDSTGTLSNPWGAPGKYRYVRYNSTSNPAITSVTGPFIVYWTDVTYTTVTPVYSESVSGTINSIAGLAMPNPTALTTLTATTLNGNWIWMCVGGYVSNVYISSASVSAGYSLYGTSTNFLPGTSNTSTAPPSKVLGYAQAAGATDLCEVLVTIES